MQYRGYTVPSPQDTTLKVNENLCEAKNLAFVIFFPRGAARISEHRKQGNKLEAAVNY